MADETHFGSVVPISDEQAKAIAAVAGTGSEGIKAASQAGSWVATIIQDVPKDLIGVLGGDWLHNVRQRNLASLEAATAAHLENIAAARRAEPSPSVLVPLLTAAVDESREELQNLWAALLANAMIDDGRKVRRDYFDIVRRMEPLDALVFQSLFDPACPQLGANDEKVVEFMRAKNFRGFTDTAYHVSIHCLHNIGLILGINGFLTPYGRGLNMALLVV